MRKNAIIMFFLVGVISILTSACETLGLMIGEEIDRNIYLNSIAATPEMDAQAQRIIPTDDKALVYYYSPDYGATEDYKFMFRLYLDDVCVGRNVLKGGYYVWQLTPGSHTFESQNVKFTLNTVGGETYFIKEEMKRSFWSGKLYIKLVDKETGRKVINASRLTVSDTRLCGPSIAPSEDDIKMKTLTVPEDKALVYLFWPYSLNNVFIYIYKDVFYLDNLCVGRNVIPGGYFLWQLKPGSHTIESGDEKLTLTVESGKTYFIQEGRGGPKSGYGCSLELVDNETGRERVEASRLLVTDTSTCQKAKTSSGIDLKVKNLTIPEDKALVYLYRNEHLFEYYTATVYLDDRQPTELAAGTYILWQLPPGMHTIETSGGNLSLDTKAGLTYFIRLEVIHRWWGQWKNKLQLMGNEQGCKCVADLVPMNEETE